METDSFFYQLLKQLPETLFAVLGQPLSQTCQYRFDAVEVKKSYRLDGLFIPTRINLPLYFVEDGRRAFCQPRCRAEKA